MHFRIWGEDSPAIENKLKPKFDLRSWSDLKPEEKKAIWEYLKDIFFKKSYEHIFTGNKEEIQLKKTWIFYAIARLNAQYKYNCYGKNFFEERTYPNAFEDFYEIFINEDEDVVLKMLSFYLDNILLERNERSLMRREDEPESQYYKRNNNWRYEEFDKIMKKINDLFDHFRVDLRLTRIGFITRINKQIREEIYEPVIDFLSNKDWEPVNRELKDSFLEYSKGLSGEHKAFSSSITHCVSALQAFLQILVRGETGKGDINKLVKQGQSSGIINNDLFTDKFLDGIESVLMSERQIRGDPHVKEDYAKENHAQLVLNLTMVFMQHCIKK